MNKTIEIGSRSYTVSIENDLGLIPWKESDCHGPVSEWTTRGKRAGERVLACQQNRRHALYLYYDYAEACKLALKVWGLKTKEAAAEAARKDFQRLVAFCNEEWQYITVIVKDVQGNLASLSGIESDAAEMIKQVARDLAQELYDREFGPQPDMFIDSASQR
jgi:hypothetical protein